MLCYLCNRFAFLSLKSNHVITQGLHVVKCFVTRGAESVHNGPVLPHVQPHRREDATRTLVPERCMIAVALSGSRVLQETMTLIVLSKHLVPNTTLVRKDVTPRVFTHDLHSRV